MSIWNPASVCCYGIRGDIDSNGGDPGVNIADLVFYVEYQFTFPSGLEPQCYYEADVNADFSIDIADIVYIVEYLYDNPSGPEPVACP